MIHRSTVCRQTGSVADLQRGKRNSPEVPFSSVNVGGKLRMTSFPYPCELQLKWSLGLIENSAIFYKTIKQQKLIQTRRWQAEPLQNRTQKKHKKEKYGGPILPDSSNTYELTECSGGK